MAACEDDTATAPTDSGLPADATTTDAGSDATNTAPDAADANASADAQSDGTTASDAGSDSGPLDADFGLVRDRRDLLRALNGARFANVSRWIGRQLRAVSRSADGRVSYSKG